MVRHITILRQISVCQAQLHRPGVGYAIQVRDTSAASARVLSSCLCFLRFQASKLRHKVKSRQERPIFSHMLSVRAYRWLMSVTRDFEHFSWDWLAPESLAFQLRLVSPGIVESKIVSPRYKSPADPLWQCKTFVSLFSLSLPFTMRPTAVLSALNFFKDKFNLFNNDVVAWEYAKKCIQVHADATS